VKEPAFSVGSDVGIEGDFVVAHLSDFQDTPILRRWTACLQASEQ